jgi:hypothetical protein
LRFSGVFLEWGPLQAMPTRSAPGGGLKPCSTIEGPMKGLNLKPGWALCPDPGFTHQMPMGKSAATGQSVTKWRPADLFP